MSWTRPHTNRLLFEAGVSHQKVGYAFNPAERAEVTLPGILNLGPTIAMRNMSGWLSGVTQRQSPKATQSVRGAVSFVTGSHNLKIGMTGLWLWTGVAQESDNNWMNILTFGGFPITARYYGTSIEEAEAKPNIGLYAQEQWTIDRLTVNAGLRFDYVKAGYPDEVRPTSVWVLEEFSIPGKTLVTWKDFQPRLGLAYDLSGNGKTALKFSANRYGQRDSTDWVDPANPAITNRSQSRTWNDGLTGCVDANCVPGDGFPQGDPLNPDPNGELLSPLTNPAFGLPVITTFYDPDWAFGWGNRQSNWEITGSVQHELASGVSVDVGYFHRRYGNFPAVDNQAVGPEDYDRFTVLIPGNPQLPQDLVGNSISLYDIKPGSIRTPDLVTTSADNFGGESRSWNGVDITFDARLEDLLLQGGVSTGSLGTNQCDQLALLPENQLNVPIEYCETSQNWLTQFKLIGSYMLPYEVQVAATFQSHEGPARSATVLIPTADIAAALGRPPTTANRQVNAIPPGTAYGERFNQVDIRFTKILSFGGTGQIRAMFDMFNLLNSNAVTREDQALGPAYLRPNITMAGRLAKFTFQFDF